MTVRRTSETRRRPLREVVPRGDAQAERDGEQQQADDEQLRARLTLNGRLMRRLRPAGAARGERVGARTPLAMRRAPSRS